MVSPQTEAKQPKVLVCAFACAVDPGAKFFGGGDTMAWHVIQRLNGSYRLWVLTAARNRKRIDANREKDPLPNVRFAYVDLPAWLHPLLNWPGGIQLYAYIWQWRAYFVARRLHARIGFHAFHHLTYENDWMASPTGALLPVPYLRGPGGGAHRTPSEFIRRYPFRCRLWERARRIGQWIFRHDPFFILGQHRAKAILVCNREALDAIPEKWRRKARFFPVNGVPREAFQEGRTQIAESGVFRLVTAGRLVRLKAFDLAIRAFAQFVERTKLAGSTSEVSLCIVGEGPEGKRLEALARDLGVGDRIQFSHWQSRAELWARMRSSDAFLFTSLRDGGGAVVVEAMAAGKPVVCVDLGGPPMHVTSECGIKIKPHSPEQLISDLASALELLYRHPELRLKMGVAAQKRAKEFYLWDAFAARLMDIYREVLSPMGEQDHASPRTN